MEEYGGGPFVLRPELTDENVTTGNTGSILCLSSGHKINSFLAIQTLAGGDLLISARPRMRVAVLGGTGGGQNRKRIFEKTRVGFGRAELSLRLSYTEFCALSSGHGPRGQGFEGFSKTLDFHDFRGLGLKC